MSKSILVIDTPENCVKCILYHYPSCRCCITGRFQNNISEDFKPDWCPLRNLPEKANHPDYCDNGRYDKGWNDCIDEILKGANGNGERTI